MAGGADSGKPSEQFSRPRQAAGLFCFILVGVLAVIDALSLDYALELGPMGLLIGTGAVLLGVEGVRKAVDKFTNGQ